jgi:hypothetical protein
MLIFITIIVNLTAYHFISKKAIFKEYLHDSGELLKYRSFLLADSHGQAISKNELTSFGIYNFSYAADSYVDMLSKLNYLIEKGKPDTVFLCIDRHTLSTYREKYNNKDQSIYYSNFSLYKKYYAINYYEYLSKKYLYKYFPLFNGNNSQLFYSYIKSNFRNSEQKESDSISNYTAFSQDQKYECCVKRKTLQFSGHRRSAKLTESLNEIISLCQTNQIVLIGIKFPITGSYKSVLSNNSFKADSVFKRNGLSILDYEFLYTDSDSLFHDQDHLNTAGGKKLAKLINTDRNNITKLN